MHFTLCLDHLLFECNNSYCMMVWISKISVTTITKKLNINGMYKVEKVMIKD